jgi:hypothetical protein
MVSERPGGCSKSKLLRAGALGLAAALSGCAFFIPEHLWSIDPNLYVTSMTPKIGSRVAYGTTVKVKLKYRIDAFQEDQRYYILLCGVETLEWKSTCGSSPKHIFGVVKQQGTVRLSFPFSESTRWAVLVAGSPKVVECSPNDAWCRRPSTLGAADLYVVPLAQ